LRRERFNIVRLVCALVAALLCSPASVSAEQLPLRHYGVYEGLPHSNARFIFQDSRGYLWVGTADGLGRFDGYGFTTYDTSDGLGHSYINSITEDRQGRIWVATNGGGVSCFIDWVPATLSVGNQAIKAGQKFVSFKVSNQPEANRVNALVFDATGRLWCATDGGLFRANISPGKIENVTFEAIVPHRPVALAMGAFADSRGRLWFGIGNQIIEAVDNRIFTYGPGTEFGNEVRRFAEDHQGHLLAATDSKLLEFVESPNPTSMGNWIPAPFDLSNYGPPHCLIVDDAGALWVGVDHGLLKYKDGQRTIYTTANGLSDNFVQSLAQDRDGNLWIGTDVGGLCMVSGEPAVGFGRSEGVPDSPIEKLFGNRAGHVYISTRGAGLLEVTEGRVLPIAWSQTPAFKAIGQRIRQDSKGDWWVGTNQGLFWFRGPDLRQAHGTQITAAEGGPRTGVVGDIYEDSEGKLWFGSQDNNLFCIDRSGENGRPAIHRIPLNYRFPYRRMVRDRSGALWLASQSVLSRVVDGKDSLLQHTAGLPEIGTRALFLDSRGWLWLGLRNNGVSVTKDPGADLPHFVNYSVAEGLVSNTVWSIAEDTAGRIYLGTGRGLDRIDPLTGRVRHITAGGNMVGDSLLQCIADSRGNIWVATTNTVVKLDARSEAVQTRAPPIYLTKLQVAGAELPMPDAGAIRGPSLTLGSSGNNLLVEYVGLDFHSNHELKYQYKLDGVDVDWSPPTDQRSVNYASLAPGSYEFMVRAVNQEGLVSPEPAVVEIQVLPPVWRRWWFIFAAATIVALAAYSVHRYRLARLIELLNVRTRIASDLHDDIGSNLTKIAILSEVAQQEMRPRSPLTQNPLSAIARISRESVASMGDIVWAIDPRRDTHHDLIRRMRQFAIDMLGGAGAEVRIMVTGDDQPRRVGPDFRRQVFLIFKEAVHNAARHSSCSIAEIEIKVERSGFTLTVRDDGAGFDTDRDTDGQGLASMRKRAHSLSGTIEVISGNQGTTITLMVPWAR
jgi:ligand-binding sensor domain-containing protein/signal transduction histidine kinase